MIAYARLNGTWSQSLAPDEARSPPPLESSGRCRTETNAVGHCERSDDKSLVFRYPSTQTIARLNRNCWDRSKARSTAYFFNYLLSARFRSVRPIRIGRNTYGCSFSVRRETAHTFAMMDATKSWSLRKFLSELSCFLQNLLTREPGPCRIFCLGCERFEIGLP